MALDTRSLLPDARHMITTASAARAAMSSQALEEMRELGLKEGLRIARKFFEKRSRKGQPRVEVHVDEKTMAALLCVAFEQGFETAVANHPALRGGGR